MADEKIKFLGTILELPVKQHCHIFKHKRSSVATLLVYATNCSTQKPVKTSLAQAFLDFCD